MHTDPHFALDTSFCVCGCPECFDLDRWKCLCVECLHAAALRH